MLRMLCMLCMLPCTPGAGEQQPPAGRLRRQRAYPWRCAPPIATGGVRRRGSVPTKHKPTPHPTPTPTCPFYSNERTLEAFGARSTLFQLHSA